jgi:hypothetical protein
MKPSLRIKDGPHIDWSHKCRRNPDTPMPCA